MIRNPERNCWCSSCETLSIWYLVIKSDSIVKKWLSPVSKSILDTPILAWKFWNQKKKSSPRFYLFHDISPFYVFLWWFFCEKCLLKSKKKHRNRFFSPLFTFPTIFYLNCQPNSTEFFLKFSLRLYNFWWTCKKTLRKRIDPKIFDYAFII